MKELRNLEMEIKTMKKTYIKPTIDIVKQVNGEGLMNTISQGISTVPSTGGGMAKPGGEWGDTWTEPEADDTW